MTKITDLIDRRIPPTSQSEALVEDRISAAIKHALSYGVKEGDPRRKFTQAQMEIALSHAIIRERASARAEGRREGIEEVAKLADRESQLTYPDIRDLAERIRARLEEQSND